MKHANTKLISLIAAIFAAAILIGCGGGGGGGGSSASAPDPETVLRASLSEFSSAMDTSFASINELLSIKTSLGTYVRGNIATAPVWQDFSDQVAKLKQSAADMDKAETAIQSLAGAAANRKSITGAVGIGLLIGGLITFASKIAVFNERALDARDDADEARADNDFDKLASATKELVEIRDEVITEFGKGVISNTVTAPINTATVGGVILKDMFGNTFADGVKALSTSDGKTIVLSETKNGGKLEVATGTPVIVAGGSTDKGDKIARMVVDVSEETTIANIPPLSTVGDDYSQTEIKREPILVEEATIKEIKENDAGEYVPETIKLSYSEKSRTTGMVTYTVTATVSRVTKPTTLSISVNQATTTGSDKTISADGSVSWDVTVLTNAGSAKVTRSDSKEWQSIGLPAAGDTPPVQPTTGFAGTWLSDGSTTTTYNKLILTGPESSLSGTYEVRNPSQNQTYDVVNATISGSNIVIDVATRGTVTAVIQLDLTLSGKKLTGQLIARVPIADLSFTKQ